MKKLIILALLLVPTLCFAEVTSTIISKDQDENGNIRIWTQYKVNGVEVESRYPKIDGKYVYCTRYSVWNFYGMNDTQIKDKIVADVNQYSDKLVMDSYNSINNKDILDNRLSKLLNTSASISTTIIKVDADKNGIADTEVTVNMNGTETEKPIEEVITEPII